MGPHTVSIGAMPTKAGYNAGTIERIPVQFSASDTKGPHQYGPCGWGAQVWVIVFKCSITVTTTRMFNSLFTGWITSVDNTNITGNIIKTPYYQSFVLGIYRWPVDSPHKGPINADNIPNSKDPVVDID